MPLVLTAPKRIMVGEGDAAITFLVRTPHKAFVEWQAASYQYYQDVREYTEPLEPQTDAAGKSSTPDKPKDYDKRMAVFQEQERELNEKGLAFIVSWEDVTGEDGQPVPYSREALDDLDVAYVSEIFYQLGLHARRVGLQVASGNA